MIFNPTKKQLLNQILQYEHPQAPDDLILAYPDFLKVRDFLLYYPFNPVVFENLLRLTIDLWTSDTRISRLSLLQGINRYYSVFCGKQIYKGIPTGSTADNFPVDIKDLIFDLFKMTMEDFRFITPNQVDAARALANSLLIGMTLSDEQIKWLCDRAFVAKQPLNRVLRYPHKSRIISEWMKSNYENDLLRQRRSEVVGWIMDYEPGFEIQKNTILDDFRYLNDLDIKMLNKFRVDRKGFFKTLDMSGNYTAEMNFIFTIYGAPYGKLRKEINRLDDVSSVLRYVYTDLNNIEMKLKIWAIAWSRIEKETKVEMLKKYYSEEIQLEVIRANEKIKSADLLRWILEKMEKQKSKTFKKPLKTPPKKTNFSDFDTEVPF